MKISETINRIPSKARIVLILSAFVGIGFCILFFKLMSSPPQTAILDEKTNAKSNIAMNLKSSEINKTTLDQAAVLPKDSEPAKELEKINDLQRENAIKSGGSFVDALHLNNEKQIVTKIDKELEKKHVPNGADDVLASQREAELARREALLKKREAIVSRNQGLGGQAPAAIVSNPIEFDEESFLDKEVKGQQYKKDGMTQYIKKDEGKKKSAMSDYQLYTSTDKANDPSSKKSGNGGYGPSNNLYIAGSGSSLTAKQPAGASKTDTQVKTAYSDLVSPTSAMEKFAAPYITTGTMLYAILEIGINTDELSPVRATVVQEGPLKGAVLVGMPQINGEKSVISFKSMSVNGKDYDVDVVALDPDTMRTSLADDVDHHTFERYFKLAAASIVSGYADALSGETTTINSDGSTHSVKERLPNTADQIASAIGNVGTVLAPKYEKEFDRRPTITVNGNRDLGIMFMSGVQL